MGIERFFSSIEENNITNLSSSFSTTLTTQLNTTHFYIDFNSIVYLVKNKVLHEINTFLYKLITGANSKERVKTFNQRYHIGAGDGDTTPAAFAKAFTKQKLNKIIQSGVKRYVINMLTNYVNPKQLTLLYIAIDGVPSKSKMLKQKQRRYMGTVASLTKQRIFNKHSKTLSQHHKQRHTYEINKIHWDTSNITPGTEFLDQINTLFNSTEFEVAVKDICPNLSQYILSGPYEPGEGENKIVEYMKKQKASHNDHTHTIYSPDSDVTLLGLLLNAQNINNITILRHNQQKNLYNVINIDKLSKNLFNHVKTNTKNTPTQSNVINDIIFILTIFGNDFIPKVVSYNVKNDFTKIINKYINVLNANNLKYLINKNSNSINQQTLVQLLDQLQNDETDYLQETYMSSHYKNYNKLKHIFSLNNDKSQNFTTVLNDFLTNLRSLNESIANTNPDTHNTTTTTTTNKQTEFINILNKLTKIQANSTTDFITQYTNYYKTHKYFPRVNIVFQPYSKSSDDYFHKQILNKSLNYLDKSLSITPYDKEVYQFDSMLDSYKHKLNAYPLSLGTISIDPKKYIFQTENIDHSVKKYYKQTFDIVVDNTDTTRLNDLLTNYIEGLLWVFKYYFTSSFDRNYGNTWFYKYTNSPLMTQLHEFLSKQGTKFIEKTMTKLDDDHKVLRKNYFNCLEQLMYVTPSVTLLKENLSPPEYIQFVTKHSGDFYFGVDKIVDDLMSNTAGKSKYIDCTGSIFFTNCHLTNIPITLSDTDFIKGLRSIDLSRGSKKLRGVVVVDSTNVDVYKYPSMTTLKEVREAQSTQQSGGLLQYNKSPTNTPNHTRLNAFLINTNHTMYNHYKQKYIASDNDHYRSMYKLIKSFM